MDKILHVFDVQAPMDKVNSALHTEQGLSGWWTNKVKTEGKEGDIIDFTFADPFHPNMKIEALDNEKVVWKCVSGHEPWQDNTFTFSLSELDDKTRVMFVQEYEKDVDDISYGFYNFNWAYYLNSMKKFCETGKGFPFNAG